jgi:hypothetical protein
VRVTLHPDLFAPPVQHTLLVALLRYPLDDRHRVDVDTTDHAVAAWLTAQQHGVREEIELALELSAQAEALEPSRTAVEVVRAGPSDYLAAPLRVCLDDARRFLDSPFEILLEDAHSDRAFLERMLTAEERRFLASRIHAGFVRVAHGGGIPSMTRRVVEAAAVPENRHKLWALFDSDAMMPGAPSAAAEALRAACRDLSHHQLRRRYTESYLPHRALHSWATAPPRRGAREERLARFRAFIAMTDDQRHHYNMKRGFDGDRGRTDATAGELYADVPAAALRALASGFGEDIAELFAGESVTEADLRRDTGWAELRPALTDLLARIR